MLEAAGLRPKKSWGQNFLRDGRVLADITAACGAAPGVTLIELGCGLGALTHHLLAAGSTVIGIERDRELAPLLRRELGWAGAALDLREADAAGLDYAALRRELGAPLTVVGNLPYQVGSRILVSIADAEAAAPGTIARVVVMVQREVAERLSAAPGSRAYGLLSVLVGRALTPRVVRTVRPGAFLPPPKVHSAVVALTPRAPPLADVPDAALVTAARAGFSGRRKVLKNSLRGALGAEAAAVVLAIESAGLDPGCRAETLGLDDFARLGRALLAAGLAGTGAPFEEPQT